MISTHILDTSIGFPAGGVRVVLEKEHLGNKTWISLGDEVTNSDGRISFQCPREKGPYRLLFYVENYFQNQKKESFYPMIPVVFNIIDIERKYHVPLLLNPYGYSTYRGS